MTSSVKPDEDLLVDLQNRSRDGTYLTINHEDETEHGKLKLTSGVPTAALPFVVFISKMTPTSLALLTIIIFSSKMTPKSLYPPG